MTRDWFVFKEKATFYFDRYIFICVDFFIFWMLCVSWQQMSIYSVTACTHYTCRSHKTATCKHLCKWQWLFTNMPCMHVDLSTSACGRSDFDRHLLTSPFSHNSVFFGLWCNCWIWYKNNVDLIIHFYILWFKLSS